MNSKSQIADSKSQTPNSPENCGLSRRDFLKLSAVAGGAAFLGALPNVQRVFAQSENGGAYELAKITNQINTVCLQCNTVCGIKVKLLDGVAAKIDGSPYSPWTLSPHLKYDTPLAETGSVEGAICPKGQAGLQTVYDPYRIVKALKRKPGTQRGQNQWVTVEFDQALQEIVDGGDLFGEGPVPGLKDSFVLTDSKVAKAMADEVKKVLAEKDEEKKAGLLAEFKKAFAADLDKLIDPDHPDFGPKNNQVVFNWGRLKGGRSDFINRFTRDGFGSTNTHGHTTVCQGSLYFSGKAMSEKLVDGKWSGGDKFYWQGDVRNSEFVIFVGASPFEGNYGPPWRSRALTEGMVDGRLKYAVVDPRLSKTAAKAAKWIPIQPGTEGAMALALIGWVIDHEKYDAKYLSEANKSAATKAGYSTWTEAAWLVKMDKDGNPSTFLRASEIGLKEKEPRPLSTDPEKTYDFDYFVVMQDGQPVPFDPYSEEEGSEVSAKYQESTIYSSLPEEQRYPAQRNWYPLSSDIYQEIIPSIGDAYPYPVKALFLYMGSPVYSLPAGHKMIDVLSNPAKLPLFVTFDVTIGETSMYSDYIFPDTSYLERWEFNGSHPSIPFKVQGIRQPAIAPLTPEVTVYGQTTVMSLESVLMGLAEKLGFKNFGPGGMKDGGDLTHPDHLILKMVANVAFGEKEDGSDAVPDADETELSLFEQARRHLPKSVFDVDRWKSIVGEALWPKVVFVLNRGGRFQNYADGYKGSKVANKYGRLINIYQEKTYGVKSSMTGKHLAGYAKYFPAPVDVTGKPVEDPSEYDLRLITYREIMQTKSRTSGNYWLTALLPENAILMNVADAAARGLADGDPVKITSASNPEGVWDLKNGTRAPMIGKVKAIQGIRPGVIAFALGFGHFAYGSVDFTIDGTVIRGEARRGRGVHANAAMRVDPYLGNTPLVDAVGGSAVFYDTMVKVVKA